MQLDFNVAQWLFNLFLTRQLTWKKTTKIISFRMSFKQNFTENTKIYRFESFFYDES